MRYAYPCDMVPDVEDEGWFVVTFPDVPEAITCGKSVEESLYLAEDALLVALTFYTDAWAPLPVPSPLSDGQVLIKIPPLQSAKLALYTDMRERGVSQSDLADALGVGESDIRDLLDLDWDSSMAQVADALEAVKSAERVPA